MAKGKKANHYEEISLLITHYNRSLSLERLLKHFDDLDMSFKDIVVSDDGSKPEHIEYITALSKDYDITLVTTPKNKGLGNNINKGQDAITSPFTFYIQEDFIPLPGFNTHLNHGLLLLKEKPDFDVIRFYAYNKYPFLKPYKWGFSEMLFKWWYPGLDKFAFYSDHPHLRRDTYFQKFGRYLEGTSGDKTEFGMMMSVLQNKGKAFFYDEHKSILEQVNSSDEPSTMKRNMWRNSDNFLISWARVVYRYLNCYSQYFLNRAKV